MSISEKLVRGEDLDSLEKQLHARAMAAVDKALRDHGVSLTGAELTHVSAEIADFVVSEKMGVPAAAEAEHRVPKRGSRGE